MRETATAAPAAAEAPAAAAAAAPAAAKPQAPRRRGAYKPEGMSVLVSEAEQPDVSFEFGKLPETVQKHLSLHGLWMYLRAADKPQDSYDALLKGEVVQAKVASGKPAEMSPWKVATAHTWVALTAKHATPMTLEQALKRAEGLDRQQLAKLRADPSVIKQHAKLFPPAAGTTSVAATLLTEPVKPAATEAATTDQPTGDAAAEKQAA